MSSGEVVRSNQALDQYYTLPSTAEWVVSILKFQPWWFDITHAIEPTAGKGAFVDALKGTEHYLSLYAFDLEPKHPRVKKADALRVEVSTPFRRTLLLGNPPYGLQCQLAEQVWSRFPCAYSAFIVPRAMLHPRYLTKAGAKPADHDLLMSLPLPSNLFELPNGDLHPVQGLCLAVTKHKDIMDTPNPILPRGDEWKKMSNDFRQFRRTEALLHCDEVLVRFGGRAGTLLPASSQEVKDFVKKTHTPGQNLYSALFYGTENAKKVVNDILAFEKHLLLEANSGPLGISGPRLQRVVEARL